MYSYVTCERYMHRSVHVRTLEGNSSSVFSALLSAMASDSPEMLRVRMIYVTVQTREDGNVKVK